MNVFHCGEFQTDLQSLMHSGLKWTIAGGGLWEMKTIKRFISVLDSQICWPKYAQPVIHHFSLSSRFQVIDEYTAVPTSSFIGWIYSTNI